MVERTARREEMGEIPQGTVVGGVRIARLIGRGRTGAVYEGLQLGLGRRVAVKLLCPELAEDPTLGERLRRWPDHPHVLRLYGSGTCGHGRFVVMPLLEGLTLEDVFAGAGSPGTADRLVAEVRSAVEAIHAQGLAHGAVSARNVLIDSSGRSVLADFGLGLEARSQERDREAVGQLARRAGAAAERRRPRLGRGPRGALLGAGGLVVIAVAALVWATNGPTAEGGVGRVPRAARAIGIPLTGARTPAVACDGAPPSGGSPACTLMQSSAPNVQMTPRASGEVVAWSVRGAAGDIALEIARPVGGRWVEVATSQFHQLTDSARHTFSTALPLRSGDRIALELAPGAAIGLRRRAGANVVRWVDPLGFAPRRAGETPGLAGEIMLRAFFVPGRRSPVPLELTGVAAARARSGVALGVDEIALPDGSAAELAVVRLPGRVVLDLLSARGRIARIAVPDADPRGRLAALDLGSGPNPGPHLEWSNPGGATVQHDYRIAGRALTQLD